MVGFYEIWYRVNSIQEDLDAIIFNSIASIILKLLRFKVVGFHCLCSMVTVATELFTAVNSIKLS
jgi:hypothetical protein